MCKFCDMTVELLKETKGVNSGDFTYVQFTIPFGEPKLVRSGDNGSES